MAVFLVIGLVFLGLGLFSPKAHGEAGVFGGPAIISEAPAGFSGDTAMLASQPLPDLSTFSSDTSGILHDSNILKIAALQGISGPNIQTNRNSGKSPDGSASDASASDSEDYFILPTQGFNWGKLHLHNAVDIANSCGAPVVASAQGLASDLSLDSWSDGYGHYVILAHPNGTKTRYAHLDKIFISLGQYVKQGDLIGTVGRTGDATGCHVHFEIGGVPNPFVR
ncbi:MAG: M23 family metallopeptidase [Candidatus Liptonbacteria bacterium]|nr:M23 family metallopeptidase [Candidatus Liptonbacteria bacterium]